MNNGMNRVLFTSVAALCMALVCFLVFPFLLPGERDAEGSFGFVLTRPAFAQTSAAFPADEAGISAYVNVGQSIDLAKAKSALRGIQAEGSNYVIGIVELPGLPEEEFPHMYVSSDGWILAYYSKFAPAARIFQWYGYEGGSITTTTLQDAIAKICPTIGVNFSQVKSTLKYYHFKYPEATKLLMSVELIVPKAGTDSFTYTVPYDVTLYEGSWSHYSFHVSGSFTSWVYIDDIQVSKIETKTLLTCIPLEQNQTSPDKLHTVKLRENYLSTDEKAGVAVVFIYR